MIPWNAKNCFWAWIFREHEFTDPSLVPTSCAFLLWLYKLSTKLRLSSKIKVGNTAKRDIFGNIWWCGMVHGYVSYVTNYEVLLLELLDSNWCQKIVLKTKTAEELFFLASYSRKRKEVFSSHFLGFQQLSRCDKFLFFTAANFSGIFCLLNSLVFWPRKKWLLWHS